MTMPAELCVGEASLRVPALGLTRCLTLDMKLYKHQPPRIAALTLGCVYDTSTGAHTLSDTGSRVWHMIILLMNISLSCPRTGQRSIAMLNYEDGNYGLRTAARGKHEQMTSVQPAKPTPRFPFVLTRPLQCVDRHRPGA